MNSKQIFLSNLAVMNIKLHNIHWNIIGEQFMPIHNFTEALYDKLFKYFDDVAEILKIQGEQPLATMKDYLENTTLVELEQDQFSTRDTLHIIMSDLEAMISLGNKIIEENEGNFQVTNLIEEIVTDLSKTMWFLYQMAK